MRTLSTKSSNDCLSSHTHSGKRLSWSSLKNLDALSLQTGLRSLTLSDLKLHMWVRVASSCHDHVSALPHKTQQGVLRTSSNMMSIFTRTMFTLSSGHARNLSMRGPRRGWVCVVLSDVRPESII